jgi:magnesium transporter
MSQMSASSQAHQPIKHLRQALESGALSQVQRILNQTLKPFDVAHLIESSTPSVRELLWELLDAENAGEVLQYLSEDVQTTFLTRMSAEEMANALSDLDTDDIADLLQHLPDQVIQEVLTSMDSQDRERIESILAYPEDSAGGLMNNDTITVRPDITLDVVFRFLRRHQKLPDMMDNLLVVNRRDEFVGILPINRLLSSDSNATVREIMITEVVAINAELHETEVAKLFERHDLVSAPVINSQGKLLGRITIDDVVDVIRDQADHNLLSRAGLDEEEDTFSPIFRSARRRAIWLGINLLTAFVAAGVMGLFEATLQQQVALAILSPVVASMGGIAGTQTLTLAIRGLAMGHISKSNVPWFLNREFFVGLLNGLLWATVIAFVTLLWFKDWRISGVIGAAIVINLSIAVIAGGTLPLLLKRFGIDPALAGGVILTTITDVVGFFAFLGLATLMLF